MPVTGAAALAWAGTAAGATTIAAGVTAATAIYSSQQQKKIAREQLQAQQDEANKSRKAAAGVAKPADVQTVKTADVNAIRTRNAQMAAASGQFGGNNSTLLTGASGVDSSSLNLGKSTLLGE